MKQKLPVEYTGDFIFDDVNSRCVFKTNFSKWIQQLLNQLNLDYCVCMICFIITNFIII